MWGVGALLGIMGLLVAAWSVRQSPHVHVDCGAAGPPDIRAAWLAGLQPAAFTAACACSGVLVWASRERRTQMRGISVVLLLGVVWWVLGEDSPLAWWAVVAWLTLVPSVLLVPGLIGAVWWAVHHGRERAAWWWTLLLGWWTLVMLIPAFVAVIGEWNSDFYC